MRRVLRVSAVAVAAVGVLALAAPAFATVRHVHPGQSIQAAINASHPGDTIKVAAGVYHQNLTITTNDITLWGAGGGRHGTILRRQLPAGQPVHELGRNTVFVSGICSVGQFDPATGDPAAPIMGPRSTASGSSGFSSTGIIFFNGTRTPSSRGNRAIGNADYGIAAFVNDHITYTHNVATGVEEAAFYVGDSPDAKRAVVTHNVATGNLFGFFFRDRKHGLFAHNFTNGTGVGIMTLDTGSPGAEGFVYDPPEPGVPQRAALARQARARPSPGSASCFSGRPTPTCGATG